MSVELEAKIKVDSHDAVRAALTGQRAHCLGRVLEINRIFDTADRTLLAGGRGLRIRTCCAEQGDDPPATMTYKGPRIQGPLKKREEIEITVDDPHAAQELLGALGFVEAVYFEKRRETWRLGDCTIELDEVPYLGLFIEIEGPDEAAVRQSQQALGFGDCETVPRSYISLLVEHCRQSGLPAGRIIFPDSRGRA